MRDDLIRAIVDARRREIEVETGSEISTASRMYKSLESDAENLVNRFSQQIEDTCRGKCISDIKATFSELLLQSQRSIESIVINTQQGQQMAQEVSQKQDNVQDVTVQQVVSLKDDLPALQQGFAEFRKTVFPSDQQLVKELSEMKIREMQSYAEVVQRAEQYFLTRLIVNTPPSRTSIASRARRGKDLPASAVT